MSGVYRVTHHVPNVPDPLPSGKASRGRPWRTWGTGSHEGSTLLLSEKALLHPCWLPGCQRVRCLPPGLSPCQILPRSSGCRARPWLGAFGLGEESYQQAEGSMSFSKRHRHCSETWTRGHSNNVIHNWVSQCVCPPQRVLSQPESGWRRKSQKFIQKDKKKNAKRERDSEQRMPSAKRSGLWWTMSQLLGERRI